MLDQLLDPALAAPYEVTPDLQAQLRPYQQDGVNWLGPGPSYPNDPPPFQPRHQSTSPHCPCSVFQSLQCPSNVLHSLCRLASVLRA